MYIIALRFMSLNLEVVPYIKVRHLVDKAFNKNFRFVMYGALLSNLALVIITFKTPTTLLFLTSLIAFLALIIDALITVKGNLPINSIINSWTTENYPANWADYRKDWLRYFTYRQIVNITGFIFLLIGTVFQN